MLCAQEVCSSCGTPPTAIANKNAASLRSSPEPVTGYGVSHTGKRHLPERRKGLQEGTHKPGDLVVVNLLLWHTPSTSILRTSWKYFFDDFHVWLAAFYNSARHRNNSPDTTYHLGHTEKAFFPFSLWRSRIRALISTLKSCSTNLGIMSHIKSRCS